MRYYRVLDGRGQTHLAVETSDGTLSSLTSLNSDASDFVALVRASDMSGVGIDVIASNILSSGAAETFSLADLIESSKTGIGQGRVLRPVDPDELWAGGPGNYVFPDEVLANMPPEGRAIYDGDRPPMMYKGGPSRLVGPYDPVAIRPDATQTIPEGELVLVIFKGEIVAYSTGNEMAAGVPGHIVPSKVFTGCASLGPCVVTPETLSDPTNLQMELTITRNGNVVGSSSNKTVHRRSPEAIADWGFRHDTPPDVALIYTGGCVADGDNPVQVGDVVRIEMEGVGYVENAVEQA